ncbi:MAG: hypothetical protein AAFY02_04970 [Pseudomonadota bacterium]
MAFPFEIDDKAQGDVPAERPAPAAGPGNDGPAEAASQMPIFDVSALAQGKEQLGVAAGAAPAERHEERGLDEVRQPQEDQPQEAEEQPLEDVAHRELEPKDAENNTAQNKLKRRLVEQDWDKRQKINHRKTTMQRRALTKQARAAGLTMEAAKAFAAREAKQEHELRLATEAEKRREAKEAAARQEEDRAPDQAVADEAPAAADGETATGRSQPGESERQDRLKKRKAESSPPAVRVPSDGQDQPTGRDEGQGWAGQPQLQLQQEERGLSGKLLRYAGNLFRSLVFVALLALPVVLAAYYYFGHAADRFQVSTVFLVRNASLDQQPSVATILGQPQSFGRAADESFSVIDYITSYEGMLRLEQQVDLRAAFSRPAGDPFYYFSPDSSTLELYHYFQTMINAHYDQVTGLVTVDVRAFRAEDAFQISQAILEESERLVNEFNRRAEADLLRLSREEVSGALRTLEQAEAALTVWRQTNGILDPLEVITRVNGIIAQLENQIALTRAELVQLGNVTGNRGSQVQRLELEARITALQQQSREERERLVGEQESLGNLIPEFELLSLRKLLAGEAYSAALVSLQTAIGQAQRQQLYVVPVVSPTVPDEAQYPRRLENVFFVFLGSLLFLTIGRLLILGIRDHIL